jgi:sRNA-binding carbon storage regulator CsrA
VHIGIKAPDDVIILREELLKRHRITAQATGSDG